MRSQTILDDNKLIITNENTEVTWTKDEVKADSDIDEKSEDTVVIVKVSEDTGDEETVDKAHKMSKAYHDNTEIRKSTRSDNKSINLTEWMIKTMIMKL